MGEDPSEKETTMSHKSLLLTAIVLVSGCFSGIEPEAALQRSSRCEGDCAVMTDASHYALECRDVSAEKRECELLVHPDVRESVARDLSALRHQGVALESDTHDHWVDDFGIDDVGEVAWIDFAGIEDGDRLVSVDGETDLEKMGQAASDAASSGKTIVIVVDRETEGEIEIVLGTMSEPPGGL